MLSTLGNILQILTITTLLLSIIIGCYRIKIANEDMVNNVSRPLFYSSGILTILTFLLLVDGFVTSDFSLKNVFLNSSTIKPLIYKVSASWASHEGSMLLWLMILHIISIIYLYQSKEQVKTQNIQIIILAGIQLLFSIFTYSTSNPFCKLSFSPEEGLGLNPALQDIALVIHPPILYLGNASFIAPFCQACLNLLKSNSQQNDGLKLSYSYTKLAMFALSLGVGLGSWWAYRELGWGGYWFFDPVENISIMPWLSGVALFHSLMISHKTGKLMGWSLGLSITTFLLCLLGLFLVRSGLLVSVHAFALSQQRALYLLIIFSVITLSSLSLFAFNCSKIKTYELKAREKALVFSNVFWLITVFILIGGVIYPIIYSLFYQDAVSITNSYYINIFIPTILPTLLLGGVFTSKYLHDSYKIFVLISVVITLLFIKYLLLGMIAIVAIFSSVFLILQTSYLLIVKTNYLKNKLSVSNVSMISSHMGFGLLVFFITLNLQLQTEEDFIGKTNDSINSNEYKITLHDIKFSTGSNYYRQIAEFWLEDKGGNITILKPENRLYQVEKTLSQESDIFSYLFYDLYAVLNRIDDDSVHAKIYYRPFISFIWFSVIMIATGFFISLIKKFLTK